MKRLIAFCLFLFALSSYSQPDYSIADSSKSWTYVKGGIASCGVCCVGNRMNKFIGDTLIDGNRYLKVFEASDSLYQNFYEVGFLFEDTITKQVFYRDTLGSEGMIYDFNVNVGDSIYVDNLYTGNEAWLHCMQIDSVLSGNQFLKHYAFSIDFPDRRIDEYWLENIGSMTGVLNCGFLVAGGFREFLCCHYQDSLIYINPHHMTCYKEEFYPHVIQDQLDTAFLNEFYFFQSQITDTSAIDSIYWYDMSIPMGLDYDNEKGILSGIPTETGSFYFYVFLMNWNYPTDCIFDTLVVVNPTDINTSKLNKKIQITPNPCSDRIFIDLSMISDLILNITVYSLEGTKILSKSVFSNTMIEINTGSFAKGMYFIKIVDFNGFFSEGSKFVKL